MAGLAHADGALAVETVGLTKRFGGFTALEDVSIRVPAGSFHALLGENGAGKSTFVKCVMGFHRPTTGQVMVADREVAIPDPKAAHALGLGMVYQHFTLVPALTAAENQVIARADVPAVIDWRAERAGLEAFLDRMPFRVPLDRPVSTLAAGEKQKLELLKQLYLGRRFLILDEPTSVLTPAEADELLGMVRGLTEAGTLTVLLITHKFREVTAFADAVSVLRRGRCVGGGPVSTLSHGDLATLMVGARPPKAETRRATRPGAEVLSLSGVRATDRSGLASIRVDDLVVRAGEIVGVAGVSGNGQTELMEILSGQRARSAGTIAVKGEAFHASRREARERAVRYLPEEPLANACAPRMTVAENLGFRTYDVDADGRPRTWLDAGGLGRLARALVRAFGVKAPDVDGPIETLSGGNVQRAVLARELTGPVDLLMIANPCFGLDFSAVAEIRGRILAARDAGAGVLLISEDLDEILELADRILVMSEGRITFETPAAEADVGEIGRRMAGHA